MLAQLQPTTSLHSEIQQEAERLEALARYDVLDTPPEEGFDRIARLIRNILGVPIAAVSLIDAHRQWVKSIEGMDVQEMPLKDTFCQYSIRQDVPLVIEDLRNDPRFAENAVVAGEPHLRSYAGVPIRTADGHNIGTVCAIDSNLHQFTGKEVEILSDLAQLAMDQLELRSLAATDSLTNLPTRRAFKEAASRAIALAVRHKHAISCIMLDLDHFKAINDTYGHAAGDEVLKAVADLMRRELRKSDLLGRLGGEEFAAVLPHTSAADAAEVAAKLLAAISALHFEFGQTELKVTASFGVAQLQTGDLEALVADADAALYEAKAAGRNRYVVHRPKPSEDHMVRRRVLKAGRIVLNNRNSTIDCTVRSLSDEGAGIDVSNTASIPDRFTLAIPSDRLEARCRVVSQTEKHIEVEFA